MSIERYNRTIPASGVIELMRGNIFLLLSTTLPVSLRAENGGSSEGFSNISGGVKLRRIKTWDNMRIEGTAGTTVEFYTGYENVAVDEVEIVTQIATISGVSSFADYPAAALTDTPPKVVVTGAQSALFAASATRRRMRVFVDENNAGTCYARVVGGANNIVNLQPGSEYDFYGFYGVDVRNDTGSSCTFYICEES